MKAGERNQVHAVLGSTSCLVNVLGGGTCDAERVKDDCSTLNMFSNKMNM
jgi:hypothetical protein